MTKANITVKYILIHGKHTHYNKNIEKTVEYITIGENEVEENEDEENEDEKNKIGKNEEEEKRKELDCYSWWYLGKKTLFDDEAMRTLDELIIVG